MKVKITKVTAVGGQATVMFDVLKDNGTVFIGDLSTSGAKADILNNIRTLAKQEIKNKEAISNLKVGDILDLKNDSVWSNP